MHVYYCSVVLVTVPDILSIIMSHVYLITLPDTCYTSCGDILSCTDILCNSMYVVSCIPCRHCYNHITVVWLFSILHINIFIFITTPLCYCYS